MPDWQLEPDEEAMGHADRSNGLAPLVDADGNPIGVPPAQPADPLAARSRDGTGEADQQWLDEVLRRNPEHAAAATAAAASRQPPAAAAAAAVRRRRPIRFSRGPIAPQHQPAPRRRRRRTARASSALNSGPWSRWTRCATSCATTQRRDLGRREDQPPAVADRARSPSSCPSASRHRRRRPTRTSLRRAAANSAVSRVSGLERAALEEALDPPRESRRSGPPQRSSRRRQPRRARRALRPSRAARRAPSSGMIAPGTNGSAGAMPRELRLDPVALLARPGERRAPADPRRAGQLQQRRAPRRAAAAAAGRRGCGRISIGSGRPGMRQRLQSGAVDNMIFQLAGIDLADRPAAGRLARLVDRLAAAGDQIMPVGQRLALRSAAGRRRSPAASPARRAWPVELHAIGDQLLAVAHNRCSARCGGRAACRRRWSGRARRSPHPPACAGSSGRSRRTALPTRRGRARTRAFPKRAFALFMTGSALVCYRRRRSRQLRG